MRNSTQLSTNIEGKWLAVREWPGQHSQILRCLFLEVIFPKIKLLIITLLLFMISGLLLHAVAAVWLLCSDAHSQRLRSITQSKPTSLSSAATITIIINIVVIVNILKENWKNTQMIFTSCSPQIILSTNPRNRTRTNAAMLAIYKDASKGHLDSDSVSVNQDGQCHGQHLASILYLWTSTIPLSCIYHAATMFHHASTTLLLHFYHTSIRLQPCSNHTSTMLPQASIFWATSGVHPGPCPGQWLDIFRLLLIPLGVPVVSTTLLSMQTGRSTHVLSVAYIPSFLSAHTQHPHPSSPMGLGPQYHSFFNAHEETNTHARKNWKVNDMTSTTFSLSYVHSYALHSA